MSFSEIERKFLLKTLPESLLEYPCRVIKQGYVAYEDNKEVRLRLVDDRPFLTIKGKATIVRTEVEISITFEQFEALWPLTEGARLLKKRYLVPWESYTVEIDVYEEALYPLVVAEIEFPSLEESATTTLPSFLGKEITALPAYGNRQLALTQKAPR